MHDFEISSTRGRNFAQAHARFWLCIVQNFVPAKKPLQDFVPGRKPDCGGQKTQNCREKCILQDFVPLLEFLLLNFCPTFVEFLSNRVHYVAAETVDIKVRTLNSKCSICTLALGR